MYASIVNILYIYFSAMVQAFDHQLLGGLSSRSVAVGAG